MQTGTRWWSGQTVVPEIYTHCQSRYLFARPGFCQTAGRSKLDRVPCDRRTLFNCSPSIIIWEYLNLRSSTFPLPSHMYSGCLSLLPCRRPTPSVTPRTVLGFPELIHLGHPLLELDVLAFLVAVSLVLQHSFELAPNQQVWMSSARRGRRSS